MQDAMQSLTYGLFVVTTCLYGNDNGCIVNTVGQVTSSPNRISVTINKSNDTYAMLKQTGIFTVSVLSEQASFDLIKRFGFQSGRTGNKFTGFDACKRATNWTMYLTEGTTAFLSGKVVQEIDLGTHTMFIADVTETGILSDATPLTYAYYLEHIKPKPQVIGKTEDGQTIWRCTVCGYEYLDEDLPKDFICPLCHHPASDFEQVRI